MISKIKLAQKASELKETHPNATDDELVRLAAEELMKPRPVAKEAFSKRKGYKLAKTATGRASSNCDDAAARMLEGKDLESAYDMLANLYVLSDVKFKGNQMDHEFWLSCFKSQYEHLNPGMQRMALGHRLRAAINRTIKAKVEGSELVVQLKEELQQLREEITEHFTRRFLDSVK